MDDYHRGRYEPDVSVVDVEPTKPAPKPVRRRRVVTDEELDMQVLANGQWHRRTPDLAHTACGERFQAQFAPIRRNDLAGPLCAVCFTAFERQVAELRAEDDRRGTT